MPEVGQAFVRGPSHASAHGGMLEDRVLGCPLARSTIPNGDAVYIGERA